jgi:hypothetical protein
MYVYLDESGNLSKGNGECFIVGSYTVGDPSRIARSFRKWQKRKFPRKLKYQSEIKFNDPHIDDKLRLKTVRFLAKQDIRIFYTFLQEPNIPENYRKGGKVYETGLLYTEIIGSTLELYLPISEREFRVFRDRRRLKGVSKNQFDRVLTTRLLPQLPAKTILQIEDFDSASSAEIQVADWVCGSLARYHENKPLGKRLHQILKNNIVRKKELFENYWEERWK